MDEEKLKDEGWDYEIMPRHGRYLISIYKDSQPIGSVLLDNKEDVELWNLILKGIDNKEFMKEMQKSIHLK